MRTSINPIFQSSILIQGSIDHSMEKLECPICLELFTTGEVLVSSSCRHSFCLKCLRKYVLNCVENSKLLNVPCPQAGCPHLLQDDTIKLIFPNNEDYKKYKQITLQRIANRDLRNLFCPKPGCSRPLVSSKNKQHTTCKCGTQVCNICGSFKHEGTTCLEAIDSQFELFSKENDIRFCLICKTIVKREEGCIHITCPICDYQWCWNCGREYSKLHECLGYWTPLPPSELSQSNFITLDCLKKTWEKSSKPIKICLKIALIIIIPLVLLGAMLFWPILISSRKEISRRNIPRSILTLLFSLIVGILTLPITIICVAILILFSPILYRDWKKEASPSVSLFGINVNKRWLTGDASTFTYKKYLQNSKAQESQQNLDERDLLSSHNNV